MTTNQEIIEVSRSEKRNLKMVIIKEVGPDGKMTTRTCHLPIDENKPIHSKGKGTIDPPRKSKRKKRRTVEGEDD